MQMKVKGLAKGKGTRKVKGAKGSGAKSQKARVGGGFRSITDFFGLGVKPKANKIREIKSKVKVEEEEKEQAESTTTVSKEAIGEKDQKKGNVGEEVEEKGKGSTEEAMGQTEGQEGNSGDQILVDQKEKKVICIVEEGSGDQDKEKGQNKEKGNDMQALAKGHKTSADKEETGKKVIEEESLIGKRSDIEFQNQTMAKVSKEIDSIKSENSTQPQIEDSPKANLKKSEIKESETATQQIEEEQISKKNGNETQKLIEEVSSNTKEEEEEEEEQIIFHKRRKISGHFNQEQMRFIEDAGFMKTEPAKENDLDNQKTRPIERVEISPISLGTENAVWIPKQQVQPQQNPEEAISPVTRDSETKSKQNPKLSKIKETRKKKKQPKPKKKKIKKKKSNPRRRVIVEEIDSDTDEEERTRIANGEPCIFDKMLMMKIAESMDTCRVLRKTIHAKIASHKTDFLKHHAVTIMNSKSHVQEQSVPVYADVQTFDFDNLAKHQKALSGRLFDVVMMDPPWRLATAQPSRGVAIGYSSLNDDCIQNLPVGTMQESGFLLIWVINAKYSLACQMFETWGYGLVDEIVWVKKTVTGKIAKGHGFYLQHAKETCLVGFKGDFDDFLARRYCLMNGIPLEEKETVKAEKMEQVRAAWTSIREDVIFSERRGQSQKPNEIYQIVEDMVPNGYYLEIFGRRNNLQPKWVTLGNEL